MPLVVSGPADERAGADREPVAVSEHEFASIGAEAPCGQKSQLPGAGSSIRGEVPSGTPKYTTEVCVVTPLSLLSNVRVPVSRVEERRSGGVHPADAPDPNPGSR